MLWHILKKLNKSNIEIQFVKHPSAIKKVDFAKMINDLYNSKISDDVDEDVAPKKYVANIVIGLLEKSQNETNISYLFDNQEDIENYYAKFGGSASIIKRFQDDSYYEFDEYSGLMTIASQKPLNNNYMF